jgi:hypothetical protein
MVPVCGSAYGHHPPRQYAVRMTPFEILTLILSGVGLLGGLVAFVVAQRASRKAGESERAALLAVQKSTDAQADAAASLQSSAGSHAEIAGALKEIAAGGAGLEDGRFVQVFQEALNAKVEWSIEERAGSNSYRLRNVGNVGAEDVELSAIPLEHAALLIGGPLGNLDAGQAAVFTTSPRLSLSLTQVTVTWIESDTKQPMSTVLNLP